LAEFRTYYGPTMNAFEAATADGREAELQGELETLFNEQNTSDDRTSIPATFLRVTVRVRSAELRVESAARARLFRPEGRDHMATFHEGDAPAS
jgi:hypothetical protein